MEHRRGDWRQEVRATGPIHAEEDTQDAGLPDEQFVHLGCRGERTGRDEDVLEPQRRTETDHVEVNGQDHRLVQDAEGRDRVIAASSGDVNFLVKMGKMA